MIFTIIAFGLVGLVWFVAIVRTFKSEAEEEEKQKRNGDKNNDDY